eukprot:gb/GEZN01001167.1/.p1 GENE.gb/GEZN01001167.1/~~gb/GEZN01001167.1/.p1  ORF type:complete len:998 (-),score=86.89 gb/GEZN01001167.1/:191-3184(-)
MSLSLVHKPTDHGILLVGTIDGNLHGLDAGSGKRLWTIEGKPLVAAYTSSSFEPQTILQENGFGKRLRGTDDSFVFPSVDGSLYTVDASGLRLLPIAVQELVQSSPFKRNGVRFLGDKETQVLLLNKRTGAIQAARPDDAGDSTQDLLWFSKTDFTIRAFEESGRESWNVSLGRYDAFSDQEVDTSVPEPSPDSEDPILLASVHGPLLCLDAKTHALRWKQTLRGHERKRVTIASVHFVPADRGEGTVSPRVLNPQYVDVEGLEGMTTEARKLTVMASFLQAQHATYVGEFAGHYFALPSPNNPLLPLPPGNPIRNDKYTIWDDPRISAPVAEPEAQVCSRSHPTFPTCLPGFHPVTTVSEPLMLPLPEHPEIQQTLTEPASIQNQDRSNHYSLVPLHIALPEKQHWDNLEHLWFPAMTFWLGTLTSSGGEVSRLTTLTQILVSIVVVILAVRIIGNLFRGKTVLGASAFHTTRSLQEGKISRNVDVSDGKDNGSEGENKAKSLRKPKKRKKKKKGSVYSASLISLVSLPKGPKRVGKMMVQESAVLGTGSRGTIVCEGYFEGRMVAIKRMVKSFYGERGAAQEVALLIASDEHPNVVRYYAQEEDDDFIYIALERCAGSLEDLVEGSAKVETKLAPGIKNALHQQWRMETLRHMVIGLNHLHNLKIVHRDLKPANILYTGGTREESKLSYDVLTAKIGDMGLGKQLDLHRSSFDSLVTGSVGWQPPELLKEPGARRLTKAVDIFSAGCIIFYVLTHGQHPYGPPLERDLNITRNHVSLGGLDCLPEAQELVEVMINPNADERISADEVVSHCFFWEPQRRLNFLLEVSDCVEALAEGHVIREVLERRAEFVVGDWRQAILPELIDTLGKFRKYNYGTVRDCLRVIRNKAHHYRELSVEVKRDLGTMPDGFLSYFTSAFPCLFLHVYAVFAIFVGNTAESRSIILKSQYSKFPVSKQDVATLEPYFANFSHQRRTHLAKRLQLDHRQWYPSSSYWSL